MTYDGCRVSQNDISRVRTTKNFKLTDSSKSAVLGAAPEGATDRESAARAVREMFTSIAPRYDF